MPDFKIMFGFREYKEGKKKKKKKEKIDYVWLGKRWEKENKRK